MIDLNTEKLISFSQASARVPGRPSLCTLWRWRTKGVRGRKLEAVIIGGRPYTSAEALARFARQESGEKDGSEEGGGQEGGAGYLNRARASPFSGR